MGWALTILFLHSWSHEPNFYMLCITIFFWKYQWGNQRPSIKDEQGNAIANKVKDVFIHPFCFHITCCSRRLTVARRVPIVEHKLLTIYSKVVYTICQCFVFIITTSWHPKEFYQIKQLEQTMNENATSSLSC
jgi:hypothetical protein